MKKRVRPLGTPLEPGWKWVNGQKRAIATFQWTLTNHKLAAYQQFKRNKFSALSCRPAAN